MGIVGGGDCLGSNSPSWQLSGGQMSRGKLSRGNFSGGNCPGGIALFSFSAVHEILWKNVSTLRHFLKKYLLFNLNIIGPKSDKSASEFLKLCFDLC